MKQALPILSILWILSFLSGCSLSAIPLNFLRNNSSGQTAANVVSILSAPPASAPSEQAQLTFSGSIAGSSFQCQVDGGAYSACTSPQSYAWLSLGAHTFNVYAVAPGGSSSPVVNANWTTTLSYQEYLYVPSSQDPALMGYSISSTTGGLTAISGAPWNSGSTYGVFKTLAYQVPASGSVGPSYLYSFALYPDYELHGFSINAAAGGLTELSTSPYGSVPANIQNWNGPFMDPQKKFVYMTFTDSMLGLLIEAFKIGADGSLVAAPASPYAVSATSTSALPTEGQLMTFNSAGTFAYIVNPAPANSISAYSINPANGALSQLATYSVGSNPDSAILDASGKFLAVSNLVNPNTTITISMFTVDPATGLLTSAGADVMAGEGPSTNIIFDPTSHFLYEGGADGYIYAFSIDQTMAALTPLVGTPYHYIDSNWYPFLTQLDPTGNYLLSFGNTFDAFQLHADGSITAVYAGGTAMPGSNLSFFNLDPSNLFVYAVESIVSGGNVYGFSLSSPPPMITALGAGSPVTANGAWPGQPIEIKVPQ